MVKIADIARALEADVLAGEENLGRDVGAAMASDLVSDVLLCRDEKAFLFTGLASIQVLRAAEMIDLVGVCLVRGKEPPAEMVAYAREMGLPFLRTKKTLYESCGLVYRLGAQSSVYHPPSKPRGGV